MLGNRIFICTRVAYGVQFFSSVLTTTCIPLFFNQPQTYLTSQSIEFTEASPDIKRICKLQITSALVHCGQPMQEVFWSLASLTVISLLLIKKQFATPIVNTEIERATTLQFNSNSSNYGLERRCEWPWTPLLSYSPTTSLNFQAQFSSIFLLNRMPEIVGLIYNSAKSPQRKTCYIPFCEVELLAQRVFPKKANWPESILFVARVHILQYL